MQPNNSTARSRFEKTLVSNPLKLYLDVEKEFDAVRDKSEDLLWPGKPGRDSLGRRR